MKRSIVSLVLALVAAAALGVGVVSAQGPRPPIGAGRPAAGAGPLHTYVMQALAAALDLEADDVSTRLTAGESMAEIALSEGIEQDGLGDFLRGVHEEAMDLAVTAGALTEEEADLMRQHTALRPGN